MFKRLAMSCRCILCSVSSLLKISRLSMQQKQKDSVPRITWLINFWKLPLACVSPWGNLLYSKVPRLVQNAVYLRSEGRTSSCQKALLRSMEEKVVAPRMSCVRSWISGRGQFCFFVREVITRQSCTNRKGPSFFFTKWTGDAQGLQEGVIICRFKISFKIASSALAFPKLSLLGRKENR